MQLETATLFEQRQQPGSEIAGALWALKQVRKLETAAASTPDVLAKARLKKMALDLRAQYAIR